MARGTLGNVAGALAQTASVASIVQRQLFFPLGIIIVVVHPVDVPFLNHPHAVIDIAGLRSKDLLPGRALDFFPGDPAPPWRKPRPARQRSAGDPHHP